MIKMQIITVNIIIFFPPPQSGKVSSSPDVPFAKKVTRSHIHTRSLPFIHCSLDVYQAHSNDYGLIQYIILLSQSNVQQAYPACMKLNFELIKMSMPYCIHTTNETIILMFSKLM